MTPPVIPFYHGMPTVTTWSPIMSLNRRFTTRTLAGAGALALTALMLPVSAASAQTARPAGGFADARGVIVDLTVLTAVPLPGLLGNTPLDPNTFSTSSQSCLPQAAAPASKSLLNVNAAPAATANTVSTMAGARCDAPAAVASAQTEGATALVNAGVPIITADVIRAQANSDCVKAPNAAGSLFANLKVNGTLVPLGPLGVPAPNTTITIPGVATVIINEQHPTASGRGIVVNGVHVIGASPLLRGDLIISHAMSGVVCPNGKGSEIADGLVAPEITFSKDASPSTAKAGDTVTYTAKVTNTSAAPCDVVSFFDHLSPVVEFVSTSGGLGTKAVEPAPLRADGGQDVILRPTDVVLASKATVTQKIVVKLKNDVKPGTYFNSLEIFCAVNGNFASGPIAPVTVPAAEVAPILEPVVAPVAAPEQLPRTGASVAVSLAALGLVGGGLALRRRSQIG
ncbi:MAG: DUF11 domain-containing protein [Frankiales bacterium]|nr:DUF11 domain-containing protein [Frankiales bacterium]